MVPGFYCCFALKDNGAFSQKVFVNGKTTSYSAGGPAHPEKIKALSGITTDKIKFESAPYSVQYLLVE
ncbi:hypothetical protein [Pedobacter sp. N23S346]|uniref:hypothetical protein n=1 Tax=Pedobacter sp. N23S346 TaxID=3402750 RepID=UPI003AD11A0D